MRDKTHLRDHAMTSSEGPETAMSPDRSTGVSVRKIIHVDMDAFYASVE
ncbi:DNA polymerase IV, partial [Agrobacterium vitis]|nr:DNA polymerase IV [Allorhizobium ampelinum]